jgi:hypothetical protein
MSNAVAETFHLRVTRTSKRDIQVRDAYVRINGGKERVMKFGDSFEVELPAGTHEIAVTNRLFKKKSTFTLGPDATFEVANVVGGCLTMLFILGIYSVAIKRTDA